MVAVLSIVALVMLCLLLFITVVSVRVKLGSQLYSNNEDLEKMRSFFLLKFRSMTNDIGEDGRLFPDSQRLTKFGKFLRSSSLDKLLEFINIIRGDMSIVGSRSLSIF